MSSKLRAVVLFLQLAANNSQLTYYNSVLGVCKKQLSGLPGNCFLSMQGSGS